jgi:glutaconyl-CoA decarboxylase
MNMYSMPGYFQNMPTVGKALVNPNPENEQELKAVENDIHESIKQALDAGITSHIEHDGSCRFVSCHRTALTTNQ